MLDRKTTQSRPLSVASTGVEAQPGASGDFFLHAQVLLGDLDPSEIEVQAIYGEVDLDDDLIEPTIAPMEFVGDGDHPGWCRFRLEIMVPKSGNFGATVRVVPRHDDVESYVQLGRVAWAPTPT